MLLEQRTFATIVRIASKEVTLFFTSPIAYLFLACFAAVTLFVFFWGEAFFARNIADVRPLFEWMPVLLIFLASTLTMRLWSEERRSGTLEHILTQPLPLWYFVLGKFLGCVSLLLVALVITLPLPISVALIGDLDWGPVWSGYLATLLLGAAYLSIGLFVSARSDNQIVSLISAVALCSLFYAVGTPVVTDLFANQAGEWLRLLGSGSRFDAITRGVLDFRDLYYYLSIIAVFLTLNTFYLERQRWAAMRSTPYHRHWQTMTALLLANAMGANLWLGQIDSLRVDTTQGKQYSISPATQNYIDQLREPLMMRAYFSSKTHPLLSPLVPQLRDLMLEYEVAGDGNVRVEFIDPVNNPELEQEANQKYGIHPVPFQVADRYQSSIVSSYFNVLVQYGDEYEVLDFRDLIEIKAQTDADIDVQLRNPEHDLTRAVKKVLQSYQAGGNLFDTVEGNIKFTGYISADSALPEKLLAFKNSVMSVVDQLEGAANGRLKVEFLDPDANQGTLGKQIAADFGFQPMTTNVFSNEHFYFYLTLSRGDTVVQIPLDDMSEEGFQRNLEAGIKRFASGFTKTVAYVAPEPSMPYRPYAADASPQFTRLEQFLGADLNVQIEDLSDGRVSGDADILVLMAPKELDEQQLFAVDQFLMQGGTVIVASSPYSATFSNRRLSLQNYTSGMEQWLSHHGLKISKQLVLDPQNAAFPVPVTRNVGGFQLQEYRMLDYPWFVDVRNAGLNQENPITANLPQLTMAWSSPIQIDPEQQHNRSITELIRSSEQSWLSSSTDIMPQVTRNGVTAYQPQGDQGSQLLAVSSQGRFESYFKDKESPLLNRTSNPDAGSSPESDNGESAGSDQESVVSAVIEHSPESARIILFSSNDFLRDDVLGMAGAADGSEYLNSLQLAANSIDWSLEDAGLLSIRARGHFNRTLPPMENRTQLFWEYLNYSLAIIALAVVGGVQRYRNLSRQRRYLQLLNH